MFNLCNWVIWWVDLVVLLSLTDLVGLIDLIYLGDLLDLINLNDLIYLIDIIDRDGFIDVIDLIDLIPPIDSFRTYLFALFPLRPPPPQFIRSVHFALGLSPLSQKMEGEAIPLPDVPTARPPQFIRSVHFALGAAPLFQKNGGRIDELSR